MDYMLIAVIFYVIGIMSGLVIRKFLDRESIKLEVNVVVLVAVTFIWTLSMVIDISSPNYETSPFVHGLMGVIVGFFFKPWERRSEEQRVEDNRRRQFDVEEQERQNKRDEVKNSG